ncbi:sugar ABC transporter permease [Jiangella aurantiaca]|uniref:Sugar ABC transporter permease n=1 Tax=Jiangella aurantiaca TaxID=2530373 RepID=A0A4R5AL84_9ACTN|nr:sugar ABC transporter permease [Jiangella aurantiaca]TDD72635.1 sugar ABC transporter permease [Jiangella aurantiaca]
MTTDTAVADATAAEDGAQPPATPSRSRRRRRQLWIFLAPAVLLNLVWGWYPLATSFVLSFTDARLRGDVTFTGFESYERMINDPLVAQAFRVSIIFAVLSIVLTFVVPILVAILLMEMPRRTMRWMMLLWFLPLSSVGTAILWRYVYNTDYGLLQSIATGLGFDRQPFLNSSDQVLFWLVIPGLVLYGPGLIYLATLQSVPTSYYEAAEIEGAGFWRKIWTISLPRMRPVILMMLMFAVIGNLQQFEWPMLMTDGGPGGASRTAVMYVYDILNQLRYADATALSILLFALIMLVVAVMRFAIREDPDAPPRRSLRELVTRKGDH